MGMGSGSILSPTPIFPAGYGVTTDGTTVYINASTCNYNYRPLNPPVVFDLPNKP